MEIIGGNFRKNELVVNEQNFQLYTMDAIKYGNQCQRNQTKGYCRS